MPDPILPTPFFRTLVQSLVPTKQTSKVTAADTETATRWEVDAEGVSKATAQQTKLVGMDTETRTEWKAVSAKGGGMGLDEFVRGSAVVPMGTKAIAVQPKKPFVGAKAAGQSTVVTGAETLTKTTWKVDGEEKTATSQATKLESFDTKTKTRWVFED